MKNHCHIEREIRARGSKLVISDDRDKEVEFMDPVTITVSGKFKSDTQEDKLKRVRGCAKVKSPRVQRIRMSIYMAFLGLFAAMMSYGLLGGPGAPVFSPLEFALLVLVMCSLGWQLGPVLTRRSRIRYARRITTAMMQEGLCLACAYDLCGLKVDTDGCVVCPECGAAWRVQPLWVTKTSSGCLLDIDRTSATANCGDDQSDDQMIRR